MKHPVTIALDMFDTGCLPGVLSKEIAATEQHRRVAGHLYSPEAAADVETYLGQLRACLEAVEKARADSIAELRSRLTA